jgi:DnaK suppressor protein
MREHMVLLLSRTEEDTKPVELGSSFGRLSRIDAIQMRGMAEMSRRQLEVRRQLVELALSALGSGTYGSCRHCGATIGFRRLQALPETPFCVDCQEGFERER